MRTHLAVWAGQSVLRIGRKLGRGGTSLPGMVALRIQPTVLGKLARGLTHGTVIITGTNGKTTTAALLAAALRGAGFHLIHNRTGANLLPGLASAFLEARAGRGDRADLALMEVDEAAVLDAVRALRPRGLVVTNFFRDQLDRFGELDTTVSLVGKGVEAMASGSFVALNADDPLVASLGRLRSGRVIYYGIEDTAAGATSSSETREQRTCLVCGRPLTYDTFYYGHLGRYRCPGGDFERPAPTLVATSVESLSWLGTRFSLEVRERGDADPGASGSRPYGVEIPVPGLYNVYNALAAITAAAELGLSLPGASDAIGRARATFGRMEIIDVKGRRVVLALVKNPTGFNQVLRTFLGVAGREPASAKLPHPSHFIMAINDRYADGVDVSWLWDVDFELLASRRAELGGIVAAGLRACDMALRLKYAGVARDLVTTSPNLGQALDIGLEATPENGVLFITPTYTAMLELRDIISRRGYAPRFWEADAT